MNLESVLSNISAGILVTDRDFKIVWLNSFEEIYYDSSLEKMQNLNVIECHKEENRASIRIFLESMKSGELKEFTKIAAGMAITYSSYFMEGEFAGIVRTRIKLPEQS